jgi:hypothetical protein
MRRLISRLFPAPQPVLFNWPLRIAYVLLGAAFGCSFALAIRLPAGYTAGSFVCLSLLRIILEAGQS